MNYKKFIAISSLIFIIGMLSQLLAFLLVDRLYVPPPKWIANLVNKCGETAVNASLENKSMVMAGIFGMSYGAYLGILVYRY